MRASMERRFAHDFSSVRIHADARAAESAEHVNARAYTVGANVVFGAGQYAPDSQVGQRLIAHELAHVVQQTSGRLDAAVQRIVWVKPDSAAGDILGQFNKLCPGKFAKAGGKGAAQITADCKAADRGKNKSCGCLCDVAHDTKRKYTITVAAAKKGTASETLDDGTTATVPTSTVFPHTFGGDDPAITMAASKGSSVEFGAFKADNKAFWLDNWRILAHELCGHGRLRQTYSGDRGCRSGHDSTIDTENEIAAEHGGDARGKFGNKPRQGESFLNPAGDRSKVLFNICPSRRGSSGLHYEAP
jgi:hypothetical protein